MSHPKLDPFTRAYLECALWTSDPDPSSGEWSEHDDWTIDAIDPKSLEQAIADCKQFSLEHEADLQRAGDDVQNGHDFWLTRNGHGAGFWDRGYGAVGRRLTEACRAYREVNVFGPETDDQGCRTEAPWDGVIYIE